MGQKVHPHGFRLGYIYDWNRKWYADRNYTELLHEDLSIRRSDQEDAPGRRHLQGRDRAKRQPGHGLDSHGAARASSSAAAASVWTSCARSWRR